MDNYDSIDFEDRSPVARFPEGAFGYQEWQRFCEQAVRDGLELPVERPLLSTPRLFVSYKREDRAYALRMAYLADRNGFQYWLDVLDPKLAATRSATFNSPEKQAGAIASILEVGLLNSSHLLAVVTDRTKASRWVPYEFGRVKDRRINANQAGSWLDPTLGDVLPEYLCLCPVLRSECEIEKWFVYERTRWGKDRARRLAPPVPTWIDPMPDPLPSP
jgi:hypothetical protein